MKTIILVLLICSIKIHAFAQGTLTKMWDKRFGGTADEYFHSFQKVSDGGYILGGSSYSGISGDITLPNRDMTNQSNDFWIIKIDSLANGLWDNRFGGSSFDWLSSVCQTTDGGYILGGYSYSGIGGEKSQANWDSTLNTADYWIVKTDASGNFMWDKRYGGFKEEKLMALHQTTDGGYILGGYSYSGLGGDKSQPNWDSTNFTSDYWIVKIDASGNKEWDKRFGGIANETFQDIHQTLDGGYILAGFAYSDISGDKTEDNWSGCSDYWIVKIDALGTKQWDKRYGGWSYDFLYSLRQVGDGGYILAGLSTSVASGNKTQDTQDTSMVGIERGDYWIVRVDSIGNMLWDADFGGVAREYTFKNISLTDDGGYLLSGSSYSNISGDKTEDNLGPQQTWMVKTDSSGVKQWDKTLLTLSNYDQQAIAIEEEPGCYTIASFTRAGIGGHKSQPNWDTINIFPGLDFWIIKFCDSIQPSGINLAQNSDSQILVSPNPFTNEITISLQNQNSSKVTIRVQNKLGQSVYDAQHSISSNSEYTINLGNLTPGMYFLEIFMNGKQINKKILKI